MTLSAKMVGVSIVVAMGPLLARFCHARVAMPGGCAIGPIDPPSQSVWLWGQNYTGSRLC